MIFATPKQPPRKPIHPFPARMAPEISNAAISSLSEVSTVMDPMAGSGSTLRIASEAGHHAIGIDSDPLAIILSRAWNSPSGDVPLAELANEMIGDADKLIPDKINLPWIDNDTETSDFVNFWFAEKQQADLRRIAYLFATNDKWDSDHLRVALSRIIITKSGGASLARDVSHSRPHRVKLDNDYDVFTGFIRSADFIDTHLRANQLKGQVDVFEGDARNLSKIETRSIDLIVTSPPYLNAIDYMRGHKLSLIWLGYSISSLRRIRGDSIGSERMASIKKGWDATLMGVIDKDNLKLLKRRQQYILLRYVSDITKMLSEAIRVLKPNGELIIVVGPSTLNGVVIVLPDIVRFILDQQGFIKIDSMKRDIPERSRYLPPPSAVEGTDLSKRIRSEVIFHASKCY